VSPNRTFAYLLRELIDQSGGYLLTVDPEEVADLLENYGLEASPEFCDELRILSDHIPGVRDSAVDFLKEACVVCSRSFRVPKRLLYNAYTVWCIGKGISPAAYDLFKRAVYKLYPDIATASTKEWYGLALKEGY